MIKIELATQNELDRVKEIAEACAKNMIENNIFQWNDKYPSREIFKEDIKNKSLYVSKINQEVVGCIMFSSRKDDVYKTVNWITEDEYNLYIHRLAVHPIFQKRGIARKMMDFAEDFAKSNNYISIRLDTFSQNPRNNKFYKSRGYNKLDDVYFPKQSEFPFHCYEKLVVYNPNSSRSFFFFELSIFKFSQSNGMFTISGTGKSSAETPKSGFRYAFFIY